MRHERFQPAGADATTPVELAFEADDHGRYRVARDGGDPRDWAIVDIHRSAEVWSGILRDPSGLQRPFRAATERRRDSTVVHLWLDGAVHRLETAPPTARRRGDAESAGARGDLAAPMPGTILQINAAPGETIAAHAPVVVMESMKMEMTIPAPADGTVNEVLCAVGERVELGAILVRLDLVGAES